jgi:hypothetical protein
VTVTQTIEWQAVLVDKTTQTTDKIRASAERAAGGQSKLNAEIKATAPAASSAAAATRDYAAAADTATGAGKRLDMSLATVQQQAKQMAGVMQKQAAAISLVSSSLGESAGKMGEVVKGAGQMAAAFGAGGPWAAALVGGIALVGQFNNLLERKLQLQDEELKKQHAAVDAASATNLSIAQRLKEEQKALTDMGKTAGQKELELFRAEYGKMAAEAGQQLVDALAKGDKAAAGLARRSLSELEQLRTVVESRVAMTERLAKGAGVKPPRGGGAGDGGPSAADEFARSWNYDTLDEDDREIAAENARLRKERNAEAWAEADERRRAQEAQAKAWDEMERAMTEATRREAEERERLAGQALERQMDEASQLTQGYASAAAGILGGLAEDLATSQEHALERAALAVAERTGNELVGHGTATLGLAAASLVAGNLPGAALQAGVGTALIGAGIGMGATTAALAQRVSGLAGGGSGGGRSEPGLTSAPVTRDRGGSGGQATTNTYVINYVSGGPLADQAAATNVELSRRAGRRLLEGVTRR